MKRIIFLAGMLIPLLSSLTAQNVAYIQRDSIYRSLPGFTTALQRVDSINKAYTAEINQKQADLQAQWAKLLNSYNPRQNESVESIKQRMSVPDTTKLSILIQEDKTLQNRAKSYSNIVNFMYQKDINPVIIRVNDAIALYAKKNKTDIVFEIEQIRQTVAYINKGKDITGQIIEILKK